MEIIVNGEKKEVDNDLSVEAYLQKLEINLETVVVECDSTILHRDEYGSHILQEGSVLELIRFIGGG